MAAENKIEIARVTGRNGPGGVPRNPMPPASSACDGRSRSGNFEILRKKMN